MKIYAFDTETTTKQPAVCYLAGFCDIYDETTLKIFTNIEEFIDVILCLPRSSILYAHNLKFDYSYIFNYLKTHEKYKKVEIQEMITGIDKRVRRIRLKTKENIIELRDSFAIFSRPLNDVMKGWNKTYTGKDQSIIYYEHVPEKISDQMMQYFKVDILGLAEALRQRLPLGKNKLTTSSDSKNIIKEMINERFKEKKNDAFSDWFFPSLNQVLDGNLRPFYRGGFCYVNPLHQSELIEEKVTVMDVNSMYPDIMENYFLPYGLPIQYDGKPKETDLLYVVKIIVDWCEIKENCCPFLVNGGVTTFFSTLYCSSVSPDDSEQRRTFYLARSEYEMFLKTYNFGKIIYKGGYYFKKRKDLFKPYVEKFRSMKENNKGALRECAKLFLNAPSGKWGENPVQESFHSELVDGVQKFVKNPPKPREKLKPAFYLPVSLFITSYARMKLIDHINRVGMEDFLYCDTDSVHYKGEHDNVFKQHQTHFGFWKKEGEFDKSIYHRTKRYAHEKNGVPEFTCAGIGKKYFSSFKTIEDFKLGTQIPVDRMKMVKGGMQMITTKVTI